MEVAVHLEGGRGAINHAAGHNCVDRATVVRKHKLEGSNVTWSKNDLSVTRAVIVDGVNRFPERSD